MKKILIISMIVVVMTGSLFTFWLPSYAQDAYEYTVLAPLPGIEAGSPITLQKYIPIVFNLLIGLSAVTAVLMIVIGGFQYMSTDAIQQKSAGKERIKNAVFALVLVIGSWLILNEINPNLLNIDLNIEAVKTSVAPSLPLGGELSAGTGSVSPGYNLTEAQIATNAAMVADLETNHVKVNGGPCATATQTTGCTNLVGMPEVAYSGVKNLQAGCSNTVPSASCGDVTITGGTEGGHKSHGPNLPSMDLSYNNPALNNYITNTLTQTAPIQQTSLGPVYTVRLENGQNATFLKESNPPHWHAVFSGK